MDGNGKREIDDDELMEAAASREQAEGLRKALRVLRDNPAVGGALQEMAQDVLSGRIGMKEAVQQERYVNALGDRLAEIRRRAEALSPEEERANAERFERWQEERRAEEERERAEQEAGDRVQGPNGPGPKRRGGPSHLG